MKILLQVTWDEDQVLRAIIVEHLEGTLMIVVRGDSSLRFMELDCPDLACAARCWCTSHSPFVWKQVESIGDGFNLLGRRQGDVVG